MCGVLSAGGMALLAANPIVEVWGALWPYLLIFAGFSAVIFVHELGHFMAAKWADVRVEKFAIGFFGEVFGFTRGETRYSFNILPLGGYVKMLGQEDFDDKTLELNVGSDPRAFSNKSVFQRAVIVSAGVIMNVIFAAFLFVIVFMNGMEDTVTTVGYVMPDSPASLAGLQPGDTIRKIDGREIDEYSEIKFSVLLADPHEPLDFEVERDGKIEHLAIKPEPEQQKNLLQVGILPAMTREVAAPLDARSDPKNPQHLRSWDKIVAIEGKAIDEDPRGGVEQLLRTPDGRPARVTAERPDKPGDPKSTTKRVDAIVFNQMIVDPSDPIEDPDTRNVLGLTPLVEINDLDEKSRAETAGLKRGDVIVRWGPHKFPSQRQITESVRQSARHPDPNRKASWRQRVYEYFTWNAETDIPVEVMRPGSDKPIRLIITPKILKKGKPPTAGISFGALAGQQPRVAGIIDRVNGELTPAAEARIPAGAMIESVGATVVRDWPQLVEALRVAAGTKTSITYQTIDGDSKTAEFRVPHCLRTQLGLTTMASIASIDDRKSATVEGRSRRVTVSATHSLGELQILRELLKRNGGEATRVRVRYKEIPYGPEQEKEAILTADMIDPWLSRVQYLPNILMMPQLQLVKASGPLDALKMGIDKTSYFVMQVYTMMQRMIVSRSVGVENMSGPVGIVKLGGDAAKMGFVKLLFFLAVISANLAVINFLPLPIVDGGLMVFLLLEKIKGSPVSMKVQVATQVIGLFLIGAAFLFVTFHDVMRLAG